MNNYTAKYYPIVNGKEGEYTTTVEATNKKSAEAMIRKAYIEQLERFKKLGSRMQVVGLDSIELAGHIAYAKDKMRIVIL